MLPSPWLLPLLRGGRTNSSLGWQGLGNTPNFFDATTPTVDIEAFAASFLKGPPTVLSSGQAVFERLTSSFEISICPVEPPVSEIPKFKHGGSSAGAGF